MDTVYVALVRWGSEWDGQSIYYTHSKALFDQMKQADRHEGYYAFADFSEELKDQLRTVRAAFVTQHPDITLDDEEDMYISEAMEWLEVVTPKFPITVLGQTKLTCSWNW